MSICDSLDMGAYGGHDPKRADSRSNAAIGNAERRRPIVGTATNLPTRTRYEIDGSAIVVHVEICASTG